MSTGIQIPHRLPPEQRIEYSQHAFAQTTTSRGFEDHAYRFQGA